MDLPNSFDIVIIGGGLVGATTACALAKANSNLAIAIVDSRGQVLNGEFNFDGRASAIAFGSSQIWDRIGVWQKMQPVSPMHTILVTDGEYPLNVPLHNAEMQCPALGYVVENAVSQSALWQRIRECPSIYPIKAELCQLDRLTDSTQPLNLWLKDSDGQLLKLQTKLLVGADGAKSAVRQMAHIPSSHKYYDQHCLVFSLRLLQPHHHIAYERFQASGPFAILPYGRDRLCIVWTATKAETPHLLSLGREEFLSAVQQKMGAEVYQQLGAFVMESEYPAVYQPQWQHSHSYFRERIVLVGDSAHTTHPVAGQGVNLGIRDADALADVVIQAVQKGEDWGSQTVLARYQGRRYWDNLGTILATDLTNLLFSNEFLPWQLLRRLGLHLFHQVLPLRQLLMFLAMGLHNLPYNSGRPAPREDAIHSVF